MKFEYDLHEFLDNYKETKIPDIKDIALDSRNAVLLPGRFYVLEYNAKEEKLFNRRPFILSLGNSVKDKDSYLGVDLCYMPRKIRKAFVSEFFKMFKTQISKNINEHFDVSEADKQEQIIGFDYSFVSLLNRNFGCSNAVKRYIIKGVSKVYAVPFVQIYKMLDGFSDENYFVNGTISDAQRNFVMKRH